MNREERRRILGDDVIAYIRARVAEAPEPSDELVETLRRILTRTGGTVPEVGSALRPGEGGSA